MWFEFIRKQLEFPSRIRENVVDYLLLFIA